MGMRLFFVVLAAVTLSPAQPSAIQSLLQSRIDRRELPGAVVMIARAGVVETEQAFGFADIESGRRMAADSVFRFASAGKIVTAAGVLALVDEGSVRLDAPVATYLPEFCATTTRTRHGIG